MAITRRSLALLRELRTEVGALADDAVRQIAEAWLKSWEQLAPAWQQAVAAMVDQAAATGRWPSSWQAARIPGVAKASAATDQHAARLAQLSATATVAAAAAAVTAAAVAEPLILASQLPRALADAAAVRFAARIDSGALESIRAQAGRRITALTEPLGPAALRGTQAALLRGVPIGADPKIVGSGLLDRIRGSFTAGIHQASTICGTETLDAYRAASAHAQSSNADTAGFWRWTCACDRRSCPACWALDGAVFPLTQSGPDGHPNCRCARLIIAKPWATLGITDVEPTGVLVDAETRFRKLPKADQLKVMGAARLELLDSGSVTWAQLAAPRTNRGWRASYAPRTVADLRRLAGQRT